jgi:hypothetical protein
MNADVSALHRVRDTVVDARMRAPLVLPKASEHIAYGNRCVALEAVSPQVNANRIRFPLDTVIACGCNLSSRAVTTPRGQAPVPNSK